MSISDYGHHLVKKKKKNLESGKRKGLEVGDLGER
jgi:hypothetical protein